MKRRDLVRKLHSHGCLLLRSGGSHDIYLNPTNGRKQPVPRHSEIEEQLARHIVRHLIGPS